MDEGTAKSVARQVRGLEWGATPLGNLSGWTVRRRMALDLCLDSGFPTLVWFGPELIQIHNEAALPILRDKHPRSLGMPARQIWSEAWPTVGPLVEQVLATGEPVRGDDMPVAVARDGRLETAWFTFAYNALRDDRGAVDGLLITALETTERVRQEKWRIENERRLQFAASGTELSAQFRALFEASPTPVLLLAAGDFRILAANTSYLRTTRTPRAALLDKCLLDRFPSGDDDPDAEGVRNLRHSLMRVVATAKPDTIGLQRYPVRLPAEEGGGLEERWWTAINVPVPGPDGRVALVIHRVEDVTEVVRLRHDSAAQDKLARDQRDLIARIREGEERYRTLFESIDEGFCVVEMIYDADGSACDYRFLEVNPAFARQTGIADPVGRTIRELVPDHEKTWFERYGEVARSGHPTRFQCTAAGLGRDFDVYACRVGTATEIRVAMLFSDVTLRNRTQAELQATQQRLEEALATAHMAWWRWDSGADVGAASSTIAQVYGLAAGQAMRKSADAQDLLHPDDRERRALLVARAVASGEGWHDEFRIVRPSDREVAWLEERATAVRDQAGGSSPILTGLIWDITERKRSELALLEADRRKNEFLATLAHELRNPLAPLRNGLHIARLGGAEEAGFKPVIAMMERQLMHLVRLVDDLLDLGRISAGKLELRRRAIRIHEVLDASIEGARATIQEHGHALQIERPDDEVWIDGDFDRLSQVFANLLSNAAKYTPRGGRICVRLKSASNRALIEVSDDGIGIPAEELGHVFDLFSQVRRHQGHAEGGLGIGLSLVRRLVEMHGGEVHAHSAGAGHGSTFTVALPLAKAQQPPVDAVTATAATQAHPCRILIADDNVDAAESLATLLQLDGHELAIARDGGEALELARSFHPDYAILDLGMPVMDGVETGRRIRSLPGGQQIHLVALTGWGQEDDRRRTREAGFDEHLIKPVDPAVLQELLRHCALGRAAQ